MTALTELIKQYVNTAIPATKDTALLLWYLVTVCGACLEKSKGVLRL